MLGTEFGRLVVAGALPALPGRLFVAGALLGWLFIAGELPGRLFVAGALCDGVFGATARWFVAPAAE